MTVSSILDGWDPNAITDGNANTFWEAKPDVFPAAETIEIQGSTDGTTFSTLLPATPVTLDAVNAHNTATVSFAPGTARWVRVVVSANTGWNAAQLAEVHLYASQVRGGRRG